MSKEMETFDARLASFDLVLHPLKRSSGAKSTKSMSWPRNGPSPAEMAHAGFYYNPYDSNPDNTTCFLCERSLDGWDGDDNPIEEHLRLSGDCGWAIMMDIQQHSSNPAEIEDPTSEKLADARQATFSLSWPHDGKRGWVCKSEKMVAGGWYFCPTEDSNDQASCPYCNLSLDGWEPKDDPFDEHYRRSSDCSFFVFAQASGKKTRGTRPKNARSSKTSRQSNQSVTSTTSDMPSVISLDDSMDQSTLSQSTGKTKIAKRSSKSKNPRSKRGASVDVDDPMDIDSTDPAQPEPPQPKRTTRGKKRSSDSANVDEQDKADTETADQAQPPTKRRSARSRDSAAQRARDEPIDTPMEEEKKPKKRGRPSKKDLASRGRKESGNSTTSKTTTTSRVPRDSELDAVLNAGLEGEAPATDDHPSATRELDRTKPDESKMPAQESESNVATDQQTVQSWTEDNLDLDLPETQTSPPFIAADNQSEPERHDSFASVEVKSKDGQEPRKDAAKKGQKKKAAVGKGKKSKKTAKADPEPLEHDEQEGAKMPRARRDFTEQEQSGVDDESRVQQDEAQKRDSSNRSSRRRSSMAPPKTTQRYSEIPHEQQFAKSLAESHVSNADEHQDHQSPPAMAASKDMMAVPSAPANLPSLSPQSSNAENQPPSTGRSTSGRRVLSPSKKQLAQTPEAAKTPSPAKQNANTGSLATSRPWVPIDIEEILFGAGSDKENAGQSVPFSGAKGELTSPEKRMTVEQWIYWNARQGEDKLKRETERLIGHFEREGDRAMRALEGIECID
ncbi:Chromosome segregation protein BIR1 [Aspergillus sp. HF37]|nr:Chromosome segregation protein BIR1 [Aspergillus sp. HF37]